MALRRVPAGVFILQGPAPSGPPPATPRLTAAQRKAVLAAITTGKLTGLTRTEDGLVAAARSSPKVLAQSPEDLRRYGPRKNSWEVFAAPNGKLFVRSAIDSASYNYWRRAL